MNIKRLIRISGFIPCTAVVILIGGAVSAGTIQDGQTSLQISLDTNTFSQGEAIIAHYKIVNSGANRVYSTMLQKNREKWFDVEVTDEAGKIVPLAQPLPPAYKGAFLDRAVISANSSCEDSLVLNQWITPLKPGKYSLQMHAAVFYTEKRDGSEQTLITKQVSFPINITALDTNRLRSEAAAARQTIETTTDAAKQEAALKVLFALPESDALPQWQNLVSNPNLSDNARERTAEEISHMTSLTAADLLAQLCWGDGGQKHSGVPIMIYLSGMWQEGDQAMKKHIENLAAEHGERTPFVPLVRLD